MNMHKRLLKALALGGLGIGCAILIAGWRAGRITTVSAQEPAPRERQRVATLFGMHTLEPRQTAQITVVNPSEIIPCVRVRLAFDVYEQDPTQPSRPGESDPSQSMRLRFVRTVSRVVELDPGEAASFDYTAGGRGAFVSPASFAHEINEESDPHTPARVEESGPRTQISTRGNAATSTLVINERGHTLFTAPGVRVGFDPQPDPPTSN